MSGSNPPSTRGSSPVARRALLTAAAVAAAITAPAVAVTATAGGDQVSSAAAEPRADDATTTSLVEEMQLVRAQLATQVVFFEEAAAGEAAAAEQAAAEQAAAEAAAAEVAAAEEAAAFERTVAFAAAVDRAEAEAAAAPPPPPPPPPPTTAPPPPPAPAPAPGPGLGDPNDPASWDRLAGCESGGNWHINTGNGYYGGLQFSLSSWRGVGGTGYPSDHSRETQIEMGKRLYHSGGGWNHWPGCTRSFGWR